MFIFYYIFIFIASVICSGVYLWVWRKHFSVQFTLMFVLVPLVNLGYALLAASRNMKEAVVANKIVYLGGCFLLPVAFFAMLSTCRITWKRIYVMLLMLLSAVVYAGVLSIGYTGIFYKSVRYSVQYGTAVLIKEYGPMHSLFYVMEILYIVAGVIVLFYAFQKKKEVSLRNILLLFICQVFSVFAFFFGRAVSRQIEWVPLAYIIDQVTFLLIVDRVCLYTISDSVADTLAEKGAIGLITFDFDLNYLNSNETAKVYLPELASLKADEPLICGDISLLEAEKWIRQFELTKSSEGTIYEKNGRVLRAVVNYVSDGRKKRGYQIALTDETKEQQYIRLLADFNEKLQEEAENRTKQDHDILDRLLIRMADMEDYRGKESTPHPERIRYVVSLLLAGLQADPGFPISEEYCKNLILASSLYDIGKLAVSNDLLAKPSRFTEEERNRMQMHAAEGGKIIRSLLEGVKDEEFLKIAENAAMYHHERWDGKGCPGKLSEIQIPLEARILAIADVFDALVTERVYKNKSGCREAFRIVMDGMGTQFDPNLGLYFENAFPMIEDYYLSLGV